MVFVHHAFGAPLLWCGVDMFFVLSGYLITTILVKSKDKTGYFATFYRHRAFRIFPAYYLAITLAVLLLGTAVSPALPWALTYTSNIHRALYAEDGALTPLWSLAVEEQFYLLWPLALWLCPPRYRERMIIVLIALAPVLRVVTHLLIGRTAASTLLFCRMDGLLLGALVACIAWRGGLQKISRPALIALAPSGALFALLAYFIPHESIAYSVFVYQAGSFFFGCVLVVVLTHRLKRFQALLQLRVLVYIGTISYSLYLLHMPALFYLRTHFDNDVVIALIAFFATFAIASISWRFVERPLNHQRDRWFRHAESR